MTGPLRPISTVLPGVTLLAGLAIGIGEAVAVAYWARVREQATLERHALELAMVAAGDVAYHLQEAQLDEVDSAVGRQVVDQSTVEVLLVDDRGNVVSAAGRRRVGKRIEDTPYGEMWRAHASAPSGTFLQAALEDPPSQLVTVVDVGSDGDGVGAAARTGHTLVLHRDGRAQMARARGVAFGMGLGLAGLVVASSMVLWVVLRNLLLDRMNLLVESLGRGQDDVYEPPPTLQGRDELSRIAAAVAVYTEDLALSRRRLAEDAAARLAAERQARAAQESAERERSFLAATLECTASAIVACDTNGQVTVLNREARRLFRLGEGATEDVAGLESVRLLDASGEKPLEADQIPLVRAFEGDTVRDVEMTVEQARGGRHAVLCSGVPVRDVGGRQLGAVVSIEEITELKEAEIELLRSYATLEQRVAERTAELEAANERLGQLDRLKSMFILSTSHELRTPLNSVLGFTGLLLMDTRQRLAPEHRQHLLRVQQAARHLLTLVNDIIEVTRIEAGHIRATVEAVHLPALVDDAVATMSVLANEQGLRLNVDPDAPDCTVRTDRMRLLQCLLNLLSNAVKYTGQGQVGVSWSVGDKSIRIEVRDTGPGLSPAEIGRLFQPFVRLDAAVAAAVPGTGLGLYLTSKLVAEVLDGQVGCDSTPGEGSTFWIDLPRHGPGSHWS